VPLTVHVVLSALLLQHSLPAATQVGSNVPDLCRSL